jgi:hypothetical protein
MNLRDRVIALAVLLVAFAARLYALGDIPFWYDEGLVGWSARLPFLETARWTAADVHPPLYFWAVTVWRLAAGESEFALRFVSAAFGFLSVIAVYKLGARLQAPSLGALAALFLGLSRFHIWWSQELRMYILGSMFMLFSVWLTLRIVHGRPARADWLAYILVSAAGLYSIYLVAFALAFESFYVVGWLLLSAFMVERLKHERDSQAQSTLVTIIASSRSFLKSRLLWTWVAAQTAVVALFLPWFLYFLTQYRTWSDSTPFDFALFVQFYATLLAAGAASNIDQWLGPVAVIWAVLLLGALVGLRGRRDGAGQRASSPQHQRAPSPQHQRARGGKPRAAGQRGGWLIVLLLVLPPLTVYLGTTPRSFFYTPRVEARYLLPFMWSFSLVLAWCVWRIGRARRLLGIAAALVVVALSGVSLSQYYGARVPNDVYQSLASALRAQKQPGDGVLLDDDRTWPIFEFYYAGGNRDWKGVPNGSKIREKELNGFLSQYWEQHDGLWLVWNEDALRIDENHAIEKWLADRAVLTRVEPFGNKRLIFYARTSERAASAGLTASTVWPVYSLDQTLYPGLTLKGYDQAVRRYRAGDEIVLGTYWHSSREDIVAAALEGLPGGPRAQQSLTIPAGDSYALLRFPVTVDMPPAEYRVVVSAGLNPPMSIARAEIDAPAVDTASPDVTIQTPREVRFQNGIRLMGYDANVTALRPGDNLPLTLYWQTSQPVAQRYKVFVHLLGTLFNPKTNNPLWGQQDQEPLNGALPTTAWGLNRIVSDQYLVMLSLDAPPGRYTVEIGWYQATSGERLTIVGGDGAAAGDHLNLLEIDVQ